MPLVYTGISRQKNLNFEDYLSIDGLSHSTLKQMKDGIKRDFVPTDKVRIGKIVDEIITGKQADITNPLYPIARNISSCMKSEIGESVLSLFEFQLSYSAWIEDEIGLGFIIKGRPDAELKKKIVVDFKVTFQPGVKKKEDLIPLINFMGYDNQLWNYGKMGNASKHFLFIHSVSAKKTFFYQRLQSGLDCDIAENWWANKILEHGSVR